MSEQLARYWIPVAIGLIGFVAVLVIGLSFRSMAAVMWSGGVVGVLTGMAIAATQRSDDRPRRR